MAVGIDEKKDISAQLVDISEAFSDFMEEEFAEYRESFAERIDCGVRSLLHVDKPKVMVYGIYNSGKSTLINSLSGEEVAEVADVPKTDRISEYDRGDYYLIDSPGIDAPIQHELVTEEYLNRCHMILFVVSSKGVFEDRTNYEKLAKLISRKIPFVIVLNDRGCSFPKDADSEQKKRIRFEHQQELKKIQYKIIDNLTRVSKDTNISEKYEVVVLNARKAWIGIKDNKEPLYKNSGIEFLERRIDQILHSQASLNVMFRQPIINLLEAINEAEKLVTQTMSGNCSDDFKLRLHTLASKKDNLMQDLRIFVQHAVRKRADELTNAYVSDSADIYETIVNSIFMEIDEFYAAKINELLVYTERNFKEYNLFLDTYSNLIFDSTGKHGSQFVFTEEAREQEERSQTKEASHFWDFLKSRKRREEEKREQLLKEAELKNQYAQFKMLEEKRKRQEARQLADSDLGMVQKEFAAIVSQGFGEKYDFLISQIQQIECINQQKKEAGERQMAEIRKFRNAVYAIENKINC